MCFYIKYETINVSHKIAPILIFDSENYNFDIRFFFWLGNAAISEELISCFVSFDFSTVYSLLHNSYSLEFPST